MLRSGTTCTSAATKLKNSVPDVAEKYWGELLVCMMTPLFCCINAMHSSHLSTPLPSAQPVDDPEF
jgi:hypothetical protein